HSRQEPRPVGVHLAEKIIDAGCVATGSSQACDKPELHRVLAHGKYDGDCRGCSFRGECSRLIPSCRDHSHLPAHQIGHHPRQTIVVAFDPMILDGYVLTVDIAGFAKTFIESGRIARIGMRRLAANDPDHGKRRLLRTRRERPRNGSTATKPNEIAPSHCLPRGSGHGIVPAQTYPGNGPAHVRFGSKADIAAHSSDVRFTPKSRHWDLAATCPLCAKS